MTALPHEDIASRPLFARWPGLAAGLPFVRLARLPTPVRRLQALGAALGAGELWLKDDGASHEAYGGNKVRKLELLLGEACAKGADSVVTFGYAGSNHAAATAVHAAALGLAPVSMLLPQVNAGYLRRNLRVSVAVGARVEEHSSQARLALATIATMASRFLRSGRLPYVIAPGGSSPLGTVGFVNAAFELAAQVEAGLLPPPGRIYAAAGSLGTVVGLAIGLEAAGLPTRVVGVRVVDPACVSGARAAALHARTVALLRRADPSFPALRFDTRRLELRDGFYGGVYARVTDEAAEARDLALASEHLGLDGTYTAKTLACLVADARGGSLDGVATLFWNTCNAANLDALAARGRVEDLPPRLRRYFDQAERDADHAAAQGRSPTPNRG